MATFHWSPEAVAELMRLRAEKVTSKAIAAHLNAKYPGSALTKIAVDNHVAKLKRKDQPPGAITYRWHPDTLALIKADYEGGMPTDAIAAKYDGKTDGGRKVTNEVIRSLAAKKKWRRSVTVAKAAKPRAIAGPVNTPKPLVRAPRVLGITAGVVKPPMDSASIYQCKPVAGSRAVTLMDRCGCAYVVGYDATKAALYCDLPTQDDRPYCGQHAVMMYRTPAPSENERMRKARYYA